MYCSVEPSGSGYNGFCFATNTAGLQRSCFTVDNNMNATLLAVSSNSYVTVYWNATSGQCTFVQVANDSATAPKR